MSYYIQVTATPIDKMNTTVTCSFKVPEHLNCTVIEIQGMKIRFSDIMDPENATICTNVSMSGRDFGHVGDMTLQPLSVRQCKAALVHHYKNARKIQGILEMDIVPQDLVTLVNILYVLQ